MNEYECLECEEVFEGEAVGGLCQECDRKKDGLCPQCGGVPRDGSTYCGPCGKIIAADHRAEVAYDERGL